MANKVQWPADLRSKLEKKKIIAVLVIDNLKDAVPTAKALLNGGVDIMELTLRTPAAFNALERIRREVPEMLPGVGTILVPEDCRRVMDAGASFGVSPGFNPDVVRAAIDAGLPFGPGIATPSDMEGAYSLGCDIQKIFPAEPLGGVDYLSSMNAPYSHLGIRFIPLGGVGPSNLRSWLEQPEVIAVGGSWIAQRALIREGRWDEIEKRARDARVIVEELEEQNR
jgi:2-dehydro-3-deoxyphosphogluconate aldolase/(4S)-4-hydroxy-2-oxoglutarate aldolase